jgi:hypothetical protein
MVAILANVLRSHHGNATPVAWIITGIVVLILLGRGLYRRSRKGAQSQPDGD